MGEGVVSLQELWYCPLLRAGAGIVLSSDEGGDKGNRHAVARVLSSDEGGGGGSRQAVARVLSSVEGGGWVRGSRQTGAG